MYVGEGGFNKTGSFNAIHAGHFNIHQHNIGPVLLQTVQEVATVVVGTGTYETRRTIQYDLQAFTEVFAVFKYGDPNVGHKSYTKEQLFCDKKDSEYG
jgi:hypothetical protein